MHKRTNKKQQKTINKLKCPQIDLIIVNIYPFSQYINNKNKDTIEMLDIGGPTRLRESAKNYESITTISSPKDYKLLAKNIRNNFGYRPRKTTPNTSFLY